MTNQLDPKPSPSPKTQPAAPPIEVDTEELNTQTEVEYGEETIYPQGPVPETPFHPTPLPEREQPQVPEIEPTP